MDEGDDLTDDYPSEEELARIRIDLTSSDIETLRACAVEGQSAVTFLRDDSFCNVMLMNVMHTN